MVWPSSDGVMPSVPVILNDSYAVFITYGNKLSFPSHWEKSEGHFDLEITSQELSDGLDCSEQMWKWGNCENKPTAYNELELLSFMTNFY